MRYLVTGDAGFIGFHTARRLLGEGHEVLGIDCLTDYYDVDLKNRRLALLAEFPAFAHVTMALEDHAGLLEQFACFRPEGCNPPCPRRNAVPFPPPSSP